MVGKVLSVVSSLMIILYAASKRAWVFRLFSISYLQAISNERSSECSTDPCSFDDHFRRYKTHLPNRKPDIDRQVQESDRKTIPVSTQFVWAMQKKKILLNFIASTVFLLWNPDIFAIRLSPSLETYRKFLLESNTYDIENTIQISSTHKKW